MKEIIPTEEMKLTIEEIDSCEYGRNLSPEKKEELISFIYNISLALYSSYSASHKE